MAESSVLDALEQIRRERQQPGSAQQGGDPQAFSQASDFEHWHYKRDAEDVLWLHLDRRGSDTNTVSAEVLKELDRLLSLIEESLPAAVVLQSDKEAGFCAGADIAQFREMTDAEPVTRLLEEAHAVLDRLERLPVPTVALLHGHCLGAGLEIALACQWRIAVEGLQTGFPEIMLGLHPGLGGTYRLTELIRPTEAMKVMLTGKTLRAAQARSLGLVDTVVRARHARAAVRAVLEGRVEQHRQDLGDRLLNSWAARELVVEKMREASEKKAPSQHYPAPHALIRLWHENAGDRRAMQKAEIASFVRLLRSETAQNLIRVFFLRQKMKDRAVDETEINHVHVIGAGSMGAEIAAWCALQGFRVSLTDQKSTPLGEAVKQTAELCHRRHRSSRETRAVLDRLIPDTRDEGLSRADLVIEAVPEDPELKRSIYAAAEARMKPGAILATNTSSIGLDVLSKDLQRPGNFIGLHFFNPVSQMMVVEIVSHPSSARGMLERAAAFVNQLGKLPAQVSTYPGFLVNRALTPYMLEAIMLFNEGHDIETIDRCARDFGMPMGPVELADQVGLDVCLSVADVLKNSLDKPMAEIPDWMREKVARGELGRKSGAGFYKWVNGQPRKQQNSSPLPRNPQKAMSDRLILPMLDACVECLRVKVISDSDLLDAAMIFGTGFAPFTGGPMHYARTRGAEDIVKSLEHLAERHGERFRPDAGWQNL